MSDPSILTAAHPPEPGALRRFIAKPEFGPLVLLVVMLVVFTAINPAFLSLNNIGNALTFTVELGLIALAMTLLMTAGEFDLSVGSVFGFAPVVMWAFFNAGIMPLPAAFLVAMVLALGIGLVSGLFVTRLGIPSFLVTLGMLLVVRGSALWLTSGFPQRTWDAGDQWLATVLVGDFYIGGLRIYMSLIWFIVLAVICHLLLTSTRFGNWIQATGGNPGAARNRGVPIQRVKVILFMLSAA
ncbi:MAG TPA: ABC transporter permease, partial [Tabrizicola sp.]|nr:ABC transporter permease [Tabrizicola sp.]